MNLDKILNLILAIAIVALASCLLVAQKTKQVNIEENVTMQSQTQADVNIGEIVYNNILTRSSVRSYSDKKISNDILEKLVRAGMSAPTAMNRQPWKFIVLQDRKTLDYFAKQFPYSKMLADANAAIIVLGDLDKVATHTAYAAQYWIQDTSAATENILLAAHGFGLGAVWTGVYPDNKKVKVISNELNLSKNLIPLCVIALGYPDSEPHVKDKWKKENIIWQ